MRKTRKTQKIQRSKEENLVMNANNNVNQNVSSSMSLKKFDWPLLLLIIGFVVISLVFIFKPGSEKAFSTFSNIITVIIPLIVVIIGFSLTKLVGVSSLQGKAILFLTIGFLCWGLADTYWIFAGQELVSFADALYFAGYLFLLIGVFNGIRLSDPGLFKNAKKLSLLLLVLVVLIGAYLYFYPLSWNYELSFLENLSTTGYLVADLLLIIPLVFLVFSLLSGVLSNGWIFFGLGVLATLVADLWYAKNYDNYVMGNLVDLLWFLGYFFAVYAFVHFRRAHKKTQEIMKQHFAEMSGLDGTSK